MLAVLLAICNVGGANATKDATHSNIAAANTWAFFQAKNIRRNSIGIAADDLELMLASQPAMPEEAKKKFEDKIKSYRAQYQSLTTDPAKQEGLDELVPARQGLSRRCATWRCARTPISTGARRCCRSPSCSLPCTLIIGNSWLLGLSGGWAGSARC